MDFYFPSPSPGVPQGQVGKGLSLWGFRSPPSLAVRAGGAKGREVRACAPHFQTHYWQFWSNSCFFSIDSCLNEMSSPCWGCCRLVFLFHLVLRGRFGLGLYCSNTTRGRRSCVFQGPQLSRHSLHPSTPLIGSTNLTRRRKKNHCGGA